MIDPALEASAAVYSCKRCNLHVLGVQLVADADEHIFSTADGAFVGRVQLRIPDPALVDRARSAGARLTGGAFRTVDRWIQDISESSVETWCWKCGSWYSVPVADLRRHLRLTVQGRGEVQVVLAERSRRRQ